MVRIPLSALHGTIFVMNSADHGSENECQDTHCKSKRRDEPWTHQCSPRIMQSTGLCNENQRCARSLSKRTEDRRFMRGSACRPPPNRTRSSLKSLHRHQPLSCKYHLQPVRKEQWMNPCPEHGVRVIERQLALAKYPRSPLNFSGWNNSINTDRARTPSETNGRPGWQH